MLGLPAGMEGPSVPVEMGKEDANSGHGLGGGDGSSSSRRPGFPPRGMWVSSEPTGEEVADLRRRFPEVVQLPAEEVGVEELRWSANAVVLRSLGRRVAAEAVARAFRRRDSSKGEVEVVPIGQDHLIARVQSLEDREWIMSCPWVVSGQLLAVERWRPRFRPSPEAICTALVWLRLPLLPVELWGTESLRAIARYAGEVVAFDPWTLKRSRGVFAKVAVRVDLSKPLRPGVLIGGRTEKNGSRLCMKMLQGFVFTVGGFMEVVGRAKSGRSCYGRRT